MIIFKRIVAENFCSWRKLDFSIQSGRYLVLGQLNNNALSSNGTGKSSLFEVIPWTLFKYTTRDKDPSTNRLGNTTTQVYFSDGQGEYCITRYFKHPKYSNYVEIHLNGEPIQNRKLKNAEEQIEQILGVNQEGLLISTTIMQGFPLNFSSFTPTTRKVLIENLLGQTIWDEYKKKFGKAALSKNELLENLKVELNRLDRQALEINTKINSMNNIQIKSTEEDINKIKSEIEDIEKTPLQEVNDIEIQKKLNELIVAEKSTSIRLSELNRIIKDKICPTCKRPWPDELISQSQKEYEFLYNKIKNIKSLMEKINKELDHARSVNLLYQRTQSKLIMLKNELQKLSTKEKQAIIDIAELKQTLEKIEENMKIIKEKLGNVEYEKNNITYLENLLLPSSDFRTSVLTHYVMDLNQVAKAITPVLLPDTQIEISSNESGIEIDMMKNNQKISYKSLSGGERRRFDLLLFFALQKWKMSKTGFKSNIIIFDEIFDQLDSDGITNVITCIDSLFSDFCSVYVISHNELLKPYFSQYVQIRKTEQGSELLQ